MHRARLGRVDSIFATDWAGWMSDVGTDLPTPNVRFQGEYWGQSGLTADASESTRMTHLGHGQPLNDLCLNSNPAPSSVLV